MRPEGGIITGSLPTWTTTNVKGMFSLREAQQLLPQNKWATGPAAPTGLSIQPQSAALALTWTAPVVTNGTITNYLVEYTPSGGATTAVLTGSTSASYTISGLTNDVAHTVRVAAVNFTAGNYVSGSGTPSASTLPNALAGLQLWYDASDATTLYNATSGGSLSSANGAVLRIEDKSGNARHAVRATTGHQAIRRLAQKNSKDVLDVGQVAAGSASGFTVTNGHLITSLHQTTSTVFFVARSQQLNSPSYNTRHAVLITSPVGYMQSGQGFNLYVDPTYTVCGKSGCTTYTQDRISMEVLGRYTGTSANNSVTTNQWSIIISQGDLANATAANRGTLFLNNTNLTLTESGGSGSGGSNSTTLFVATNNGYYNSHYFNGQFCELIVYSSVLSAGDKNGVYTYLSNKWGI
jgi:hypothetical protein